MKKCAPIVSLVLLLTFLFAPVAPVFACGPSFTIPVFAFETRPDAGLEPYARGELGIVKPDYNRSFLFVAYRYFNNAGFSQSEQRDLMSVWRAELSFTDDSEELANQSVRNWIVARKRVLPNEPEPKIYTARAWDNGYDFFPNCTANAFETATKTLQDRAGQHGETSGAVKDWLKAQDAVFANCAEGKQIPPATDSAAPAWLQKDRAYQIAAAHFYSVDLDTARTNFEQIAADANSPWNKTASYLVARTLIREASMIEDRESKRPIYEQAETRLQSILSNPEMRDLHSAASKLVNLIKYRLRPAERMHELGAILSQNQPNANLRQDLIDYRWLMDNVSYSAQERAEARAREAAKNAGKEYDYDAKTIPSDFTDSIREDDLTEWIFTFQSAGDEAYRRSLEKWRATKSAAWFVATISEATKDAAETNELLAEAEKFDRSAAAFPTVAFHQARLLLETGKSAEARRRIDSILNDQSLRMPASARNEFYSKRMFLAQNLDEFLQFAQRKAAAFSIDASPYYIDSLEPPKADSDAYYKNLYAWKDRMMFDEDATRVFNERMPFALLKQAAASRKLPDYLRRNLLIAAWTRALMLEDDKSALELASELLRVAPEFSPFLSAYQTAKTPLERRNAATFALLKYPALRWNVEKGYGRILETTEIDSYRDNWWCAPADSFTSYSGEVNKIELIEAPAFLTDAQLAQARAEREKMKAVGSGSTFVARRAVEFAQKSPKDARIPESLYLAVRATRYGCRDCQTGTFSKQAHDILKARFPRSEWTKKTPYWYKDDSCEQKN